MIKHCLASAIRLLYFPTISSYALQVM